MSTENSGADTAPERRRGAPYGLGEDWAATIVGLLLLLAALFGVIPAGLVP